MGRSVERPTMREVAELAGVSIGTVSAVFTGKRWVSPDTDAGVRQAAGQLGYEPRVRKTAAPPPREPRMVGFVSWGSDMSTGASPYFAPVLAGAQQACAELRLSISFETVDPEAGELPLCVQRGEVSGLVVLSVGSDPGYLRRIHEAGVSCVLLEHAVKGLPMDFVRHDDEIGGYLATRHLLDLGHTNPPPAIITAKDRIAPAVERLAGYRRALAEYGLREEPSFVRRNDFSIETGYEQMAALLALPVRPSAVFCGNDESALGALNALRDHGVAVPEEMSVIGYDDIAMAAHASPALTTMAVDKELLGAQAVWHLVQRIQRPAMTSRDTRLGVMLVQRQSTAPARRS
jgi:DNA-binding LacI/PurR family transcriptional regulator